jgi:hypothetical protein
MGIHQPAYYCTNITGYLADVWVAEDTSSPDPASARSRDSAKHIGPDPEPVDARTGGGRGGPPAGQQNGPPPSGAHHRGSQFINTTADPVACSTERSVAPLPSDIMRRQTTGYPGFLMLTNHLSMQDRILGSTSPTTIDTTQDPSAGYIRPQ